MRIPTTAFVIKKGKLFVKKTIAELSDYRTQEAAIIKIMAMVFATFITITLMILILVTAWKVIV